MAVIGAALHGPCVLLARTQTDMVAAENREWGLDLGAPQWHPIPLQCSCLETPMVRGAW